MSDDYQNKLNVFLAENEMVPPIAAEWEMHKRRMPIIPAMPKKPDAALNQRELG